VQPAEGGSQRLSALVGLNSKPPDPELLSQDENLQCRPQVAQKLQQLSAVDGRVLKPVSPDDRSCIRSFSGLALLSMALFRHLLSAGKDQSGILQWLRIIREL